MSFAYITEKGATVSQRDGCFVVSRNKEILFEIPKETLEKIRKKNYKEDILHCSRIY